MREPAGGVSTTRVRQRVAMPEQLVEPSTPTDGVRRRARPPRRRLLLIALIAVPALAVGALVGKQLLRPDYLPPLRLATASTALPADVEAQLAYVDRHWDEHNIEGFGDLGGTDCVNFTSQTLLARGWAMDADWGHSVGIGGHAYAPAWISSTRFREYLLAHPEKGTELSDDERDRLAVGDVAQFDWDDSGDRDHTAVVTALLPREDDTIDVRLGGHSLSYREMPVDQLLEEHPGAQVHYWHLAG